MVLTMHAAVIHGVHEEGVETQRIAAGVARFVTRFATEVAAATGVEAAHAVHAFADFVLDLAFDFLCCFSVSACCRSLCCRSCSGFFLAAMNLSS